MFGDSSFSLRFRCVLFYLVFDETNRVLGVPMKYLKTVWDFKKKSKYAFLKWKFKISLNALLDFWILKYEPCSCEADVNVGCQLKKSLISFSGWIYASSDPYFSKTIMLPKNYFFSLKIV